MVDLLTGDPSEAPAYLEGGAWPSRPSGVTDFLQRGTPEPGQPIGTAQPGEAYEEGVPRATIPSPQEQGQAAGIEAYHTLADTLANAYAKVRTRPQDDRITSILKNPPKLSFEQGIDDLSKAFGLSMSSISTTGDRKYLPMGEALNALRAQRIKEAEEIAKIQIAEEDNAARRQAEAGRIMMQAAAEARLARATEEAARHNRVQELLTAEQRREVARHNRTMEQIGSTNAATTEERLKIEQQRADETARHNRAMEAAAATKTTQRDRDVEGLVKRGLSLADAEDVAAGRVVLSTDQVTGNQTLVNKATGETKPVGRQTSVPRQSQVDMQAQNIAIQRVLRDLGGVQESLKQGVGARAFLKDWQARILGQEWMPSAEVDIPFIGKVGVGEKAVDESTTRARQKLALLREEMIEALAKAPNRVPLAEQQRLLGLLPSSGIWESAKAAEFALSEIQRKLGQIFNENTTLLGGAQRGGKSPTELTDDEIRALLGISK